MFENRRVLVTINGNQYEVEISRIIASWRKMGGSIIIRKKGDEFTDWLTELGISEDDQIAIFQMATNGKLELQENAKAFLKARSNVS